MKRLQISGYNVKQGFFNDVCPGGQMMYASQMMLPAAMMRAAAHEGNHHINLRPAAKFHGRAAAISHHAQRDISLRLF